MGTKAPQARTQFLKKSCTDLSGDSMKVHVFRTMSAYGRIWTVYDDAGNVLVFGKHYWSRKRTLAEARKQLSEPIGTVVRYKGFYHPFEVAMIVEDIQREHMNELRVRGKTKLCAMLDDANFVKGDPSDPA